MYRAKRRIALAFFIVFTCLSLSLHSYGVRNYSYVDSVGQVHVVKNGVDTDPSQALWWVHDNVGGPQNDFNMGTRTIFTGMSGTGGCNPSTCTGLELYPNSTWPAYVLSKGTVDPSSAASKELVFSIAWALSAVPVYGSGSWKMYLTTNGTLPTSSTYDPARDKSVVLLLGAVMSGTNQFAHSAYINRGQGNTVVSADTGQCSTSGSCLFFGFSGAFNSVSYNPLLHYISEQLVLNYTGPSAAGGQPYCNGALGFQTGAGCTQLGSQDMTTSTVAISNTVAFPWLSLSQSYYVGFYAPAGLGVNVFFGLDQGNGVSGVQMSVVRQERSFVPAVCTSSQPCSQPTSHIDTSGWLGGIVSGFLNIIGTYVFNPLQSIISGIAPLTVLNGLAADIINRMVGSNLYNAIWATLGTSIGAYLNLITGSVSSFVLNNLNFSQVIRTLLQAFIWLIKQVIGLFTSDIFGIPFFDIWGILLLPVGGILLILVGNAMVIWGGGIVGFLNLIVIFLNGGFTFIGYATQYFTAAQFWFFVLVIDVVLMIQKTEAGGVDGAWEWIMVNYNIASWPFKMAWWIIQLALAVSSWMKQMSAEYA